MAVVARPVGHHCHRSLSAADELALLKMDLDAALEAVALVRRDLERVNNYECGGGINLAEQHLRAIKHRLERH